MRRPLLRVGSAFPDPPFDDSREPPSGLDVDLMRAVARAAGGADRHHRRRARVWCIVGPDPWCRAYVSLEEVP